MKIGTIIFLVMTLFALLGSIAGTSYHYVVNIEAIEEQVFEHLKTATQSRAAHVTEFLNCEITKLTMISGGVVFVDFLESSERSNQNSEVFKKVKKRIDDLGMGIAVFDTNGIALVAENNPPGTDYSQLEFFVEGGNELKIIPYYDLARNKSFVGIIMPVTDKVTGQVIGAVSMDIDLDGLNKITLDKTGLGETGEIYLINDGGYAITDLLFIDEAFLEWKVDSANSRKCLEDMLEYSVGGEIQPHDEVFTTFLDYSGEKVIGTHSHVSLSNWCLLGEINEEEILGEQRLIFQKVVVVIIILITLFMSLIGFFLGRYIDRRVVLRKGKKSL